MSYAANSIHLKLRRDLENYIKSQYFGKSELLRKAIAPQLDNEGLLYQKPYIESSPAYQTQPLGIEGAEVSDWLKAFLKQIGEAGLGVFEKPFVHQIDALNAALSGHDVFVSTGTGSGKTECFMWPLISKLISEARNSPATWQQRGVRVMVMYPMNALVSDQISRLRKLIGDPEGKFVSIFRAFSSQDTRRPQFGMYTGRTPYPGAASTQDSDTKLSESLSRLFEKSVENGQSEQNNVADNGEFLELLSRRGKIPAKRSMTDFILFQQEDSHLLGGR